TLAWYAPGATIAGPSTACSPCGRFRYSAVPAPTATSTTRIATTDHGLIRRLAGRRRRTRIRRSPTRIVSGLAARAFVSVSSAFHPVTVGRLSHPDPDPPVTACRLAARRFAACGPGRTAGQSGDDVFAQEAPEGQGAEDRGVGEGGDHPADHGVALDR